jgi:hypothetical protein
MRRRKTIQHHQPMIKRRYLISYSGCLLAIHANSNSHSHGIGISWTGQYLIAELPPVLAVLGKRRTT